MTVDLEEIIEQVRVRNEAMKRALGPNDEGRLVAGRPDTPRGFTAALSSSTGTTQLLGEIKRATPASGVFAEDLDPAWLAREIETGGAAAVSVSTERPHFGGSVEDLQAAREETRLPVLRRDFIIDPYQVPRSYGAGVDAIDVLVKAVPDDATLHRIFDSAERLRLDVLTEVFDEADALRALEIGKDSPSALRLVGLCDGDLCAPGGASPETAARLAELFPETTALVYLGGVSTREEVDALRAASPRISRFAVSGMALATSEDPAAILRAILRDNPA